MPVTTQNSLLLQDTVNFKELTYLCIKLPGPFP